MRLSGAVILALSLTIAACSPQGHSRSIGDGRPAAPDGATTTGDGALVAAAFDPSAVRLSLKPFVSGLESPLGLTHAGDGSGRLFVVEQVGRIRVIQDRTLRTAPFLDISSETDGGGEQGLLGLAFHPRYERNRRFYVNYTDNAGDTIIAEYKRSRSSPLRAAPRSRRVVLTFNQPFANHNGGALAFGPDGFLYIASGDGGSAGDPMNNGQRTDTLLGKILRIDVDGREGNLAYGIPPGNPFDGSTGRREIFSLGLRNPWRITFDRSRGDLWIGDVGQNEIEEINRTDEGTGAGANYGWKTMEGDRCYPSGGTECLGLGDDFVDPIAVYSHDFGCSVTGGYVYRGKRYPVLQGGYVFGDYCSGNIWAIKARGSSPQRPELLLESGRQISSFGEDRRGELYLTDLSSGQIFRIVASRR